LTLVGLGFFYIFPTPFFLPFFAQFGFRCFNFLLFFRQCSVPSSPPRPFLLVSVPTLLSCSLSFLMGSFLCPLSHFHILVGFLAGACPPQSLKSQCPRDPPSFFTPCFLGYSWDHFIFHPLIIECRPLSPPVFLYLFASRVVSVSPTLCFCTSNTCFCTRSLTELSFFAFPLTRGSVRFIFGAYKTLGPFTPPPSGSSTSPTRFWNWCFYKEDPPSLFLGVHPTLRTLPPNGRLPSCPPPKILYYQPSVTNPQRFGSPIL